MGVCHMTIPVSAATPRHLPPERKPDPQPEQTPHQTLEQTPARTSRATLLPESAPATAPLSDTLPLPQRSVEARVQRTPEQQAEQDILTALAARCLAGEQLAWHQLVTCQHKRVYALCFRFTGDRTAAEDVTQDVFLKIFRNLATFDPAKGAFATWITTLTRNLLVDHYRRARQDRLTESIDISQSHEDDGPTLAERLPDTRPTQEHRVAGLELKATIQAALAQLSPDLREAVILRDLEDMDYKEIAFVLSIPEGTVKSRISRGRVELARLLQRREGQVM